MTGFLGRLDVRIARLATATVTKILSVILTLGILGWVSTAHAVIPASQRTVLTNLFISTNGAAWTNKTNWNGAVGTECTWHGVSCDSTQSNVEAIVLGQNNLAGSLPALSGLPALKIFNVNYNNELTGTIPSLNGLTALQSFLVSTNRLTGTIPSLSGLTALQDFIANGNQLSGAIPSLSGLTALQYFAVDNNQLTGPIPSLSGLTALQYFHVYSNQLTGSIPSLSGLTALQDFAIYYNQLTGPIPSLTGLTALQYFAIYSNQLTGPIPSLSGLTALQYFFVDDNQLTGPVPAPPTSLVARGSDLCSNSLTTSGMAAIDAAWNTATGVNWRACQIGATSLSCTLSAPALIIAGNTATLSASCTPAATSFTWTGGTCVGTNATTCTVTPSTTTTYTFTGTNGLAIGNTLSVTIVVRPVIPASQRTVLTNLYTGTNGASWNRQTNWNGAPGTECTWYGVSCDEAQSNVVAISLRGNNLVGTLPALSGLPALQTFDVTSNQLTGSIPTLRGLTSLQYFDVSTHQLTGLTGPIPSLGGLTALQNFIVYNNQLTGPIPSLSELTALQNFIVYNNQLTGPIPSLSELTALQYFDAAGNQLTGSIPSLGGLTALRDFQVYNNQLTGSIPPLRGLTALQNFIAYNNQLIGPIPSLSELAALQNFSVHNNQLTGPIPSLSGLTALLYFGVNNNQLSGPVPAPPTTLVAGPSSLCSNNLTSSGVAAIDAAWNTATGGNWQACQIGAASPSCTLSASPALITAGGAATLSASCSPAATSFAWTGGTCVGANATACTVMPSATTTYTFRGSNFVGAGNTASATIGVRPVIPTAQRTVLINIYTSTNGSAWTNKTNWNGAVGTECTWFGVTCDVALNNVVQIDLRRNNLAGILPVLSGLPALLIFDASNNLLTGPIPSLSGLTALLHFNVTINQLTGPIPSLSGLMALQQFYVSGNQLTGPIPSLGGLTALRFFYASDNQLTGPIPSLTGLTTLEIFQVSRNQLTGSIPSLSGLTVLHDFYVNNNLLTGPIPSLAGLTRLQYFDVSSNQLAGPVPAPPTFLSVAGLCSNRLTSSGVAAIDATWNTATGVNWQACQIGAAAPTVPVCELIVFPSAITAGRSATLALSCSPAATAYSWTGGACPGTIGSTCVVTPTATTTYSVTGSNAVGAGKPVSGTVTIVSPVFPLIVTNTSTPTVANVSAALQFRPQDVSAANNVYAFALAPASLVKNVPATALSSPTGPVVASSVAADGPAACVLAQLINGELRFASTSTLQPSATGVSGNLGASVSVLNGVSTALVGGAVFYVGYGTDPNAMIINGTNQSVATIPAAITCLPQTPQSGWWWYPAQDGRGFGIEVQGNNMFMSGYLYDSSGHATWMVAEGKVSLDGAVFSNKLYQVANGQSLTGAYKAPGSITFPGDIMLSFTNARSGILTWPGGIIPIQRFDDVIGQGNGVTPAFVPETGWWWNQAESGRGYFIEIKNNYAFIAGYMYEADGRPVWYIAEGAMSSPQLFSSRWYEAANGQTLTGVYKKPNIMNGNVGSASIQFLTPTTAMLTLPDGRLLSIARQRY